MKTNKENRQENLIVYLENDPFLTDEELAALLNVSVPTIRLDRLMLNISEQKERVKAHARAMAAAPRSIEIAEIAGEIIDITPGQSAMSIMTVEENMVFTKTGMVRGDCLYAMAETISIAAIDSQSASVKVANIKHLHPVYGGARLVAKAQVRKHQGNEFIVWTFLYEKQQQVFRGKFILVPSETE